MSGPDARAMLELVLRLCDDLAAEYPTLTHDLQRDQRYIASRFESEGLSFLTKTLPKLGKAFDLWLKDESAAPELSVSGLRPEFLSGVKSLISGRMLTTHDRAAVYRWLRQLTFVLYKLEVPYTERQLQDAYQAFEERDLALQATNEAFDLFRSGEAAWACGEALEGFHPYLANPKHGPGAVATREVGDEKWHFKRYYRSVHSRFPWYDLFVPSLGVWRSDTEYALKWYKSLERLDYPTARVVAVPKDSRGPRLISEEPLELQYLQQGYFTLLVSHLERHSPTAGFVNFARQDINQELALSSSRTGEWATIDLSDASDRVSEFLVYLIFPEGVYKDLRALRSHRTILPNGRNVKLTKFAPMGSAICFPVEALTFWSLCKSAIRQATKGGDGPVYVYGDDIIVPNEHFRVVCEELESFGLKVNEAKSYHTGLFRESCGVDAWNGYVITPTRLKRTPPSQPADVESLSNWIAVHNGLLDNGFELAAGHVQTVISRVTRVPWNIQGTALSFKDSASIAPELDPRNASFKFRWNPGLCRSEVRTLGLKAKLKPSYLTGWQRLHRNLLVRPRDPNRWSPRKAVSIRRSWIKVRTAG